MFIIVIGTRASGKSAIKDYLIEKEGFKHVRLVLSGASSPITSTFNSNNNNTGFRYKLDKLAGSVTNIVNHPSQHSDEAGSGKMKLQIPPVPPDFDFGESSPHGDAGDGGEGSRNALSRSSSTPAAVIEQSESLIGALDGSIGFSDPHRLLEHVTRHWREHFVTEDITTRTALEPFLKRPFVLLVSVDAPALMRFKRYQKYYHSNSHKYDKETTSKFSFFSFGNNNNNKRPSSSSSSGSASSSVVTSSNKHNKPLTLEQFIEADDRVSFGADSEHVTSAYLFASYHLCHVNILNAFTTLEQLYNHLHAINLLNPDRLRPGWDTYFMKLASLASLRSNCMKRRVGAILVSKDHTVIATGYNGTPRGVPNCNEGGCKRCNEGALSTIEGFEECLCIHAEENALLEAGRERLGRGAILYCNTCPCLKCTIKIVQNGVSEVVYNLSYKMCALEPRSCCFITDADADFDGGTTTLTSAAASTTFTNTNRDASSARVFEMAGVKLRQYSPG